MIFLYNLIIVLFLTISFPFIILIMFFSKKRRKTFLHRLGIKPFFIDNRCHNKKNIWIHALSVGEVLSAVPLVKAVKTNFPEDNILFSMSTQTGFEVAINELKEVADTLFFYPYDLLISVKHIIKKINPSIVIIVESDIWLNFLNELKNKNIPVILINARLSERSFSRYRNFSKTASKIFNYFSSICTQSYEDLKRFNALNIPSHKVKITGNIKFDQTVKALNSDELENYKLLFKIEPNQKVILAGSTHKGEELILSDAFLKLKHFNIKFIVVPRDPTRSLDVFNIFKSKGFSVSLMSEIDKKNSSDVIIVNVIGVLRNLYALSDIAFVGGSLVNCGGHNPLEPAFFSKPILFGHDMSDFRDIARCLLESGGAVEVNSINIYDTLEALISNPQKIKKMGIDSYKVFSQNKGAIDNTLKVIQLCKIE
ncbi:MAG: 3-deoxy-D-manno-octulosonic acid transferase [Desulfobacterales bacterium]|nr:3-deoxy-D-manno-octulosonic acid transferase [Desulfobacterales bacterium]